MNTIIVKDLYQQKRYNRRKNYYRLVLGIRQIYQTPILLTLMIPIIVLTLVIWLKMDNAIAPLKLTKQMHELFIFIMRILGIIISLILTLGLIDFIGKVTARKSEADIRMAFSEKELRNGSPILIYKRKEKGKGITIMEFYSPISLKLWNEKKEIIEDAMNICIIGKFRYGGRNNANSHKIVFVSIKGREPKERGILYDEQF